MVNGFGDIRFAGAKHAPVLFCLDVTGSMTKGLIAKKGGAIRRMDMANEMIRQFFRHILSIYKAADAVEVAFVLFTHEIVMETDFVNIMHVDERMFQNAKRTSWCGPWELKPETVNVQNSDDERTSLVPSFAVSRKDNGSKIDSAVLHSYKKILALKDRYDKSNTEYYAPHFILITDGDPNDGNDRLRDSLKSHREALDLVYDHSFTGRDGKNLIVPITVGVFDEDIDADAVKRVKDYAENFPSGYFRVYDDSAAKDFKKAAEFLCKTVVKSLALSVTDLEDQNPRSGRKSDDSPGGRSAEEIYGQ